MKYLAGAMLIAFTATVGCASETVTSDSAAETEVLRGARHEVTHDGRVLTVIVLEDASGLIVQVDNLSYEVPWDGQTYRCPCRFYESAVFRIELDSNGVRIHDARLDLTASVGEFDDPMEPFTVEIGAGVAPLAIDWLELLSRVSDDEKATIDQLAGADMAAYLQAEVPAHQRRSLGIRLTNTDAESLADVASWLTERVYQPAASCAGLDADACSGRSDCSAMYGASCDVCEDWIFQGCTGVGSHG